MAELPPSRSLDTISSLPIHKLLFHNESVTVIDDSAETVALLSRYLATEGLNVLAGSSTTELFNLLQREKIALILLNIELNDRNGDEIIQDLISSYPSLGIIIMTGSTDLEITLNCLRRGAESYLTKPVNINLLHHTVKAALTKRRLTIENLSYQEQLQKTNALLTNGDRFSSIGKMTTHLVHTIRNSLTSIGGTSRLLEKKITDPHTAKFLNIITEETLKIEATLKDLVTLAEEKQQSDKSQPE